MKKTKLVCSECGNEDLFTKLYYSEMTYGSCRLAEVDQDGIETENDDFETSDEGDYNWAGEDFHHTKCNKCDNEEVNELSLREYNRLKKIGWKAYFIAKSI